MQKLDQIGRDLDKTKEIEYSFPAPLTLSEYREKLKEQKLDKHLDVFDRTIDLLKDIKRGGGVGHIVGGAARDLIMNKIAKDFDVEVFGLPSEKLESIVRQFGRVQDAGKAFGILKILYKGMDIDVSLPRTDSKIGTGHRGFHVKTNPFMSFKDAARRRDLTMNSMGWDPLANEIVDPFGGIEDIKLGLVRVTDHERFGDDPLRVYRVCQFIGRFEMKTHYHDLALYRKMLPQLPELSEERIWEEWSKMMLKSKRPSLGLTAAIELGIIEKMHPSLYNLFERDQAGWKKSLAVVDQIARQSEGLTDSNQKISLMIAGLCHQLTPRERNEFLRSIMASRLLTEKVNKLTVSYQRPDELFQHSRDNLSPIRQCLSSLFPAQSEEIVRLAAAIKQVEKEDYPAGDWFIQQTKKFTMKTNGSVANSTSGHDWLELGYPQGPKIGQLISLANRVHDEKNISRDQLFRHLNHDKQPQSAESAINQMEQLLLI